MLKSVFINFFLKYMDWYYLYNYNIPVICMNKYNLKIKIYPEVNFIILIYIHNSILTIKKHKFYK